MHKVCGRKGLSSAFIRRSAVLIALLLSSLMALSAADGDGRVNYFMPMADDEHYGALLKHIFDGGDLFEAMDLATQLEMSLDSADYPEWMKDAALARALMIVARYCTQISDGYDGIASGYMSDADGLVASSREK